MKFIRQRDGMQCGAACLKMICDEYKKNIHTKNYQKCVLLLPKEYQCLVFIGSPNK